MLLNGAAFPEGLARGITLDPRSSPEPLRQIVIRFLYGWIFFLRCVVLRVRGRKGRGLEYRTSEFNRLARLEFCLRNLFSIF